MDCSHLKEYVIQTVNCSWSTKRERTRRWFEILLINTRNKQSTTH